MNTKLNIEKILNDNDMMIAKQILIADLTSRFEGEGMMMWQTLYGIFPSYKAKGLDHNYEKLMKEKYELVYHACEKRLER